MRLRSKDRRFDLRAPSVAGTADRCEFAFGDRSDSAAANGRLECFSHRTRPGAKSDRLRQSAVKRSPGIVSSPFVESPRSRRPVCSVSSALAPSTATCAIREFRAREAHAMVPLPLLASASCQVPRPRFPAQLGASLSRSPTPSRLSAVRVRLSLTACRGAPQRASRSPSLPNTALCHCPPGSRKPGTKSAPLPGFLASGTMIWESPNLGGRVPSRPSIRFPRPCPAGCWPRARRFARGGPSRPAREPARGRGWGSPGSAPGWPVSSRDPSRGPAPGCGEGPRHAAAARHCGDEEPS